MLAVFVAWYLQIRLETLRVDLHMTTFVTGSGEGPCSGRLHTASVMYTPMTVDVLDESAISNASNMVSGNSRKCQSCGAEMLVYD